MTDKLRLGIVGAGAVTQVGHLPALRKVREIDVAGICDNDLGKARALADRFDIPVVHSDIAELVDYAPLDALLVCTPSHLHESHVLAGLAAGLHVLVERPMSLTPQGVQKILSAQRKADRVVMVGKNQRYRPDIQMIRSFVQSGELGELESIRAWWFRARPRRPPLGWRPRPQQSGGGPTGFAHADTMDCASCHASWTNTCIGCHLGGEYDTGNNFSNITGERIVFDQANADFVYQSPVPFQLGVGHDGKVSAISPNTETFWQWEDRNNVDSKVFAFTDRNGGGNNPGVSSHPSLAHNVLMPHSIRGKVKQKNEGPRYCVSCHLTTNSLGTWGTEYAAMRANIAARNYGALNYNLLRTHIGSNPGNQLDSPFWVHMVAGLGSGLFLFDQEGCPENPLDTNPNRVGCDGVAPATSFDPLTAAFDLDRMVEASGVSNGSNNHPFLTIAAGSLLRDGSTDPMLSGPLGATLIRRLTDPATGIVLDSWLDANATPRGNAGGFLPPP